MGDPPPELADSIFASKLKRVRTQAGVTQQQLADRMAYHGHKMHRSAIAKTEAGERPVTVGEAVEFARVLGVSLMYLLTDDLADTKQEYEYRKLVEDRIKVRSLEHEVDERHKLLEEQKFLYENAVQRLDHARDVVKKWELRLQVREQQRKFGKSAWFEGDPDAPDVVKATWSVEAAQRMLDESED